MLNPQFAAAASTQVALKSSSYQLFVTAVNFEAKRNRRAYLRFVFLKMITLKKRKTRTTCAKGKKLKQWHGPHFLMMTKNDLKLHVTVTERAK